MRHGRETCFGRHIHIFSVEVPCNQECLSVESQFEAQNEPITTKVLFENVIGTLCTGKASEPLGSVTEMLNSVTVAGKVKVYDLIGFIIAESQIPTDWLESLFINLYSGKGIALNRGNIRGLRLFKQGYTRSGWRLDW